MKLDHVCSFPDTLDMSKYVTEIPAEDALYELYSVVIHLGGAYGGHYHAYIRDIYQSQAASNEEGQTTSAWFDFDDSRVSSIQPSRITGQFGGKSECACK